MFTADPDRWVVKGGFAMLLRLDPNRTSNDIDVAYVAEAGEHALALRALEEATTVDLDDFFSFQISRVGDEAEDRARPVALLCRLGAREFERLRVDLSLPQPSVPADVVIPPPLAGIPEVDDSPRVRTLAWPQQIADKVCAIFEQHGDGFSSRSRDLADLGLIARQVDDLDGSDLIESLRSEERRRAATSLPNGLPQRFALSTHQEAAWRVTFPNAARGAPIEFDDALELAVALVDPLLDGSALGKRWVTSRTAFA